MRKLEIMKKILLFVLILTSILVLSIRVNSEEKVMFTKEIMNNADFFKEGKRIWFDQCTHCHGYKAYPGKAPKLKPKRYKPQFVYKRIAKGFRKMPAWEEIYSHKEIQSLVVYVMDKKFSP